MAAKSQHPEAGMAAAGEGMLKPPFSRPDFEALFSHPLCDETADPMAGHRTFYDGWHADHLRRPRFYLSGTVQVRALLGQLDARPYSDVSQAAIDLIRTQTKWMEHGGDWEKPAYNQFTRAMKLMPVTPEKAAIAVVAMEIICGQVAGGPQRISTADVYKHVLIIPACYNIDSFNTDTLAKIRERPNADATLLKASGQSDVRILDDLASGNCVTYKTAKAIKDAIVIHYGFVNVGIARARPGRGGLGSKRASSYETVDS